MKILIVTENPEIFEDYQRESNLKLLIRSIKDIAELPLDIKAAYLDQDGCDCRKNCRETLGDLKFAANIPWGLIDFKRKHKDPMELMLHGWSDYLCGKDLIKRLTEERIHNILYFYHNKRPIPLARNLEVQGNPSGKNWDSIKENDEYIFGMLYTELITQEDLNSRLSEAETSRFKSEWESFLYDFFDPWFGYLWITNSWSNIILFPYDGKELHAIEGVLEFHLNAPTFRFKGYNGNIKYKQVLHLANTQFKKRNHTAHLISEPLNDLFHMGIYHAKQEQLYFTEPVAGMLPESLLPYLEAPKEFEGHKIHSLKKLL